MDIEEHVKRNQIESEGLVSVMQTETDESAFYEDLKRYIQLRYLLDDDPFWDDDLATVTKYSIKKTMESSDDPTKLADLGINCAGASSATTKQLLLIITLRKGLDVEINPVEAATTRSVRDLAALLYRAVTARRDNDDGTATERDPSR